MRSGEKLLREVSEMEQTKVPISEKYVLTISEASDYFNIGQSKLRRIVSENQNADYILMNGVKVLIKRTQFEKMIDGLSSI